MVTINWYDPKTMKDGILEVMIHADEQGKNISKAYTYVDDTINLPDEWLGVMSKNILYVELTPEFIRRYKGQIDDQIGEQIRDEHT